MNPLDQRILAERCLLSAQIETGTKGQVVERSYTQRLIRDKKASITVRNKTDGSKSDIYCVFRDGELRSLNVDTKWIELKKN